MLARTRELDPDVVLMDIRMPDLDGIEATDALARSGSRARVLVLTTFDLDEYVYRAMRAGASGFLLKDARREQLASAVRAVGAGEAILAPAITRRLIEDFCRRPLDRRRPTVRATGCPPASSTSCASSPRHDPTPRSPRSCSSARATVKSHIARVLTKLGLRDRVQIVVFAYESGLANPGRP